MEKYERVELGEHEYNSDISITDTLLFDLPNGRVSFKIATGIWTINAVKNKKTKLYNDVCLFNKEYGSNEFVNNNNLYIKSTSGFLILSETKKHKDTLKNALKYTECLEKDHTVEVFKNKIAFKVNIDKKYPIQCSAFAGLITGIKIQLMDYDL